MFLLKVFTQYSVSNDLKKELPQTVGGVSCKQKILQILCISIFKQNYFPKVFSENEETELKPNKANSGNISILLDFDYNF